MDCSSIIPRPIRFRHSVDVADTINIRTTSFTMKILYLGDLAPGQTCLMRRRALERLGHDVRSVDTVAPWRQANWFTRQFQRRVGFGSVIDGINQSVITACREFSPQLVWADKQEYLRAETVEQIRQLGARAVHFTPDPYFYLDWKRTRTMDATIRSFDVLVYCKQYEAPQYAKLLKPSVYMPLGFCDETHRPLTSNGEHWKCQFGFLGGWEPRRESLLGALVSQTKNLKVWGGYWDHLRDGKWTLRRRIILGQLAGGDAFRISANPALATCLQGGEVYGDDYARALTGAKIGLGFLRKVCPDQHTTRTFEIPACGSMLLADRTDEHRAFFEEAVEADFFSSEEELIDKARFYERNDSARQKIAQAGYRRCIDGKYSYIERMSQTLNEITRHL